MKMDSAAAASLVAEMRRICVTDSPRYWLPSEDFREAPFGISVAAVLTREITPTFTGGHTHRESGRGRVGSGLMRVPIEAFKRVELDPM